MQTTADLLDAVKAHHGLTSDYQLSKLLDLTRAQVSRYRNGHDVLSESVALQVADLLGTSPEYVFACTAGERARSDRARRVWDALAKKLAGAAAAVMFSLCALPYEARASLGASAPTTVYYVKRLRRFIRSAIRRLCPAPALSCSAAVS